MFEIIIVAAISLFALTAKTKNTLVLMFLLLPLHGFIKSFIFGDGGNIFAAWKEICILILFAKTYNNKVLSLQYINSSYLLFLFYILIFFFIGYEKGYSVVSDIRQFVFPSILMITIAKMSFSNSDIKQIFNAILLGTIIVNISGVIDFLSPELRLIMRTMMHADFTIGDDGTVYYENSSMKIMGIDRVAGLSSGGPNMMGVFNSIILIFAAIAKKMNIYMSKVEKFMFCSICLLSIFCLLLSFSRAGWAILFITFVLFGYRDKYNRKYIIGIILSSFMLVVISYCFIDQVKLVIDGTFSGNEASSAARASMTQDSFSLLLENPFGQGMGATSLTSKIHWNFAESSLINLGFCCGLIGILLYLSHIYKIFKANHLQYNIISYYASSFIIAYVITTVVSVNVVQNPFVYYAWFLMGLGLSNNAIYISNWKSSNIKYYD